MLEKTLAIISSNQYFYSQIITIIIAIVVGYILAKILGKFVKTILKRKIDPLIPEFPLSKIFKRLVEWFVYIFMINIILMLVNLNEIANYVFGILVFYSYACIGVIIIIIGYFISKKSREYFKPDFMAESIFFFILTISVLTALPFFGLKVELLTNVFLILFGSVIIGFSFSAGYGIYVNIKKAFDDGLKQQKSLKDENNYNNLGENQ